MLVLFTIWKFFFQCLLTSRITKLEGKDFFPLITMNLQLENIFFLILQLSKEKIEVTLIAFLMSCFLHLYFFYKSFPISVRFSSLHGHLQKRPLLQKPPIGFCITS